ncbi:transketolase [Iodidimonas sp. SYSU 1G8]|uniref:transketolase n=1 Tax=Iodidimonas sp. SYSU 1G8 TaxID=3133967 RepID=UPI0031FE7469
MTQASAVSRTETVNPRDMANAIRALSMDAVQAANSGHPGMPMGMADVATVLFTRFLKYDPRHPDWADRDRFVLSAGHGSMLLYSVLHLTGYASISMDDIRNFRQLGSPCAGHPEFGHAEGIETTTGPLGQGIATAVGMALAERLQAARFGDDIVDHHTYVIAGDGCLMEGISQEAISLAGHLGLSKLIVLWDDNRITIDGPVDLSSSEDQAARFRAAGWNTLAVDGHDSEAVAGAITTARASNKPTMIACRTIIGYGAPNVQGTSATHGAALGDKEIAAAREHLGWSAAPFEIPADILSAWRAAGSRGASEFQAWQGRVAGLGQDVQADFERRQRGELPANFGAAMDAYIRDLIAKPSSVATRKASEMALEVINAAVPETIGGSADLTGSNNTKSKGQGVVKPGDFAGSFIHYGIREHGMAAAMNGLALHGGLIPYSGTFMVFTDYCRPAIRLSALMHQRVIYVMTHDSIGLGEDGPTHQPVEHLASLRAMPNLNVMRPADVVETAECWRIALESPRTPSILALSRQNLAQVRLTEAGENLSARGAYELLPADGDAKVTLFATGSEVGIAAEARTKLQEQGVPTRVVSVPSFELFEAQPADYQRKVLGEGTVRIAIEAGVRQGWERFIGVDGAFIGMNGFGASAPIKALYEHFGITAARVVAEANARL